MGMAADEHDRTTSLQSGATVADLPRTAPEQSSLPHADTLRWPPTTDEAQHALELARASVHSTDIEAWHYRDLFGTMDIGFCVIEMMFDHTGSPVDYRFLEANPIFSELTGLEAPVGKRVLELVPGLDHFWIETYGRVARTGDPTRFEQPERAMDNQWFDVFASRFGDVGSNRVALLFTNITERKSLEQAQIDFVGMVSHDLGNPLAVVRGWAQLLQRRETYDARAIATIVDQTERMERLVTDLREFIKLETNQVQLRLEPIDLVSLAQEAINRVHVQASTRSVQLVALDGPVIASIDADRIGQVLDNLLSNAIKYSPESCPITVRIERGTRTSRIRVIDQGPGIPADRLLRVFDRFYRGESSETSEGVGLGLYISRMLARVHGGNLTATSSVGTGSFFTLELPIDPVQ